MFKSFIVVVLFGVTTNFAFGWGENGHRITAKIAERHLSARAKAEVKAILGSEPMALASTWADEVRSDPAFKHQDPFHFVEIPIGEKYGATAPNPEGDIIASIKGYELQMVDAKETPAKRLLALRMFIHLMGDLHQPLHVGNGKDRGANLCMVKWFSAITNLHAVWDSKMIDDKKLSYTEYADFLDRKTQAENAALQEGEVLTWSAESASLREPLYPLSVGVTAPAGTIELPEQRTFCKPLTELTKVIAPEQMPVLSYEYAYIHSKTLESQLLKGGLRLAARLNALFKR